MTLSDFIWHWTTFDPFNTTISCSSCCTTSVTFWSFQAGKIVCLMSLLQPVSKLTPRCAVLWDSASMDMNVRSSDWGLWELVDTLLHDLLPIPKLDGPKMPFNTFYENSVIEWRDQLHLATFSSYQLPFLPFSFSLSLTIPWDRILS